MRALLTTLLLLATPAHAAPCDGVRRYADQVADAARAVCAVDAREDRFTECGPQDWARWWQRSLGRAWARIGPRPVHPGREAYGTLGLPGKRLWISSGPSAGKAVFDLDHVSGRGGLEAHLCTIDATGRVRPVAQVRLPPGTAPRTHRFVVPGAAAQGRFVALDLVARRDRFKYRLTLRQR